MPPISAASDTRRSVGTASVRETPGGERSRGWQVVLAGVGINLALGILYTWSVFSKGVPESWGWSATDKSWPYAIACLVFSLVMVPAGRLQDRLGPRWVAMAGGLLVGLGMVLSSFSTSSLGYILGFGVLAGAGIGLGYASATPAAVKWFPAARTGTIAGIVVSGFGLASVYAAPLARWLIDTFTTATGDPTIGLQRTFLTLGVAFLLVVTALSQLLVVPAKASTAGSSGKPGTTAAASVDFNPGRMLQTWQFYLLWLLYAAGAGAGLMVIAKLNDLAKDQAQVNLGYALVAALGIGNGAGRVLAGMASDRIGRRATLLACFLIQAGLMLLLSRAHAGTALASMGPLALLSALIGAHYGANLALFPSITKDYYGLKNFGVNYGLVFTAWGVGGFAMPLLAGRLHDAYKVYTHSFYVAAALLLATALGTLVVRPPRAN